MKPLLHPDRDELLLANVLYALGDPIRLKIVRQLAREGEKTCGAFGCATPKSTLSHHFRLLREAGIIHSRKSGTHYMNTLRRSDLDARFPHLLDTILSAIDSNNSEPL